MTFQSYHNNTFTQQLALSPLLRVNRRSPCRICGKPDNCNISVDGRIAYCRRVPGDKQGRDGGWVHILATDAPPPTFTVAHSEQKPVERANVDHVDAVLTTMVRKCLVLSDQHKESLMARGLSESEIERNGYRSTPTKDDGDRIAREMSSIGLEGVPGFFKRGSEWHMRDHGTGIFVPVRDERLRVVGCQIRRDDAADGKGKYTWFSSNGFPCGTPSGSPIHFAKPHLLRDASEVLVTEGILKSDAASYLLDAPIIAAAGVSNFGQDFAENLKAKFPNIKTCIVAFDSDWRAKLQVKVALEKLMRQLSGSGFRVKVRTWPPHMGKGIDDYLLALASSQSKEVAA